MRIEDKTFWSDGLVIWKQDIVAALAEDLGKAEWEALRSQVKSAHGMGEVSDIYKCTLYIQQFLADAWDKGKKFPVLDRLCKAVVTYAQTQVGAKTVPTS